MAVVDINDFIVISNNFSKVPSAPGLDGDVFVDNIVDQRDFRLWKNAVSPAVAAQAGVTFAFQSHRCWPCWDLVSRASLAFGVVNVKGVRLSLALATRNFPKRDAPMIFRLRIPKQLRCSLSLRAPKRLSRRIR